MLSKHSLSMQTQRESGAVAQRQGASFRISSNWRWVLYTTAGAALVLALKYFHVQDVLKSALDWIVKFHVRKGRDEILGATLVARHAGEMISEISVAMAARLGLGRLASVIHPYPTQAEAIRQCGDAYNRTRLTPTVKKWMSRWLAWQRS